MLGHILKEARKKQGLTLSALSKQVGVTVGYISNLEHNRLEPSLPVLCDLADKLNIPPSMLLSVNEEERVVVCKKGRRPSAVFSNLPSPCEVLTPFAWRSRDEAEISVLHLSVPSGSNLRTDMPALGSDEFVYVMKGKLAYSHGDKSLPVSEGCGVFIPDMTGRTLMNTSADPAEILWVAKSENAEARKTGALPKKDPAQEEQDKDSDAPAMLFMGENIRKLRVENGMTVAALADKIGMTSAYVSKVERGLVKPLLPVLRKISKALDAEMMYLFNVPFPNDIKISKVFDAKNEFNIPGDKAKMQFLTPSKLANGERPNLSVMSARLEGGRTDYEEFVVHDFVEFTYVLEGTVEYRTDRESYVCEAGDAIYVKKNVPHLLYNPGKQDCKMIAAFGSISHSPIKENLKDI